MTAEVRAPGSVDAGNEEKDKANNTALLKPLAGMWVFDAKRTKVADPQSVSADRILKKAQVPLSKRIGLQYLFGKDVSQEITVNEEDVTVSAYVKGILSWTKFIYLDGRATDVNDSLFGKAKCVSRFDADRGELHYELVSKKEAKGKLSFIRHVELDTLFLMIRWFPSAKDDSIYITHTRIYSRKKRSSTKPTLERQLSRSLSSAPIDIPETKTSTSTYTKLKNLPAKSISSVSNLASAGISPYRKNSLHDGKPDSKHALLKRKQKSRSMHSFPDAEFKEMQVNIKKALGEPVSEVSAPAVVNVPAAPTKRAPTLYFAVLAFVIFSVLLMIYNFM